MGVVFSPAHCNFCPTVPSMILLSNMEGYNSRVIAHECRSKLKATASISAAGSTLSAVYA